MLWVGVRSAGGSGAVAGSSPSAPSGRRCSSGSTAPRAPPRGWPSRRTASVAGTSCPSCCAWPGNRPRRGASRYAATYVLALEAVTEVTGAKVVIDGSKNPIDALLLEHAGVDLRAINLVRDPRSVAASWSRRKRLDDGDDAELRRFTPWSSSVLWSLWNASPTSSVAAATGREDGPLRDLPRRPRRGDRPAGRLVRAPAGRSEAGGPVRAPVAQPPRRRERGPVQDRRRDDQAPGHRTARAPEGRILSSIASFPLTVRFRYRVFRHRDRECLADAYA